MHVRLLASDEAPVLAETLTYSAEEVRRNPRYQREMFSWTSHWQPEGITEVVTDWDAGLDVGGAAGRALVTTGVPDTTALAEAIDRESVLVFATATGDPLDLIRVGDRHRTCVAGRGRRPALRIGADPPAARRGLG